jgi:hypothetical protein
MGFSIIKKTPNGIDMYDVDSNGNEVFGSHTRFDYEDSESLWNQTSAAGGYNYNLNGTVSNGAIRMLNQGVNAVKQSFDPGGDIPDVGGALPKYTPAPVSPIQVSAGADIPVSGFGVPGGPQPGAVPFNLPPPSSPKVVEVIPEKETVPDVPTDKTFNFLELNTIFNQIKNIDQLKEAYFSKIIGEAQVTSWMAFHDYDPDKQKEIWDSWSKEETYVDTTLRLSKSSSVAGSPLDTPPTDVVPHINERGERIFTASSYSSVPWNPIYKDFIDKNFDRGNPIVQYWNQQGLSNDPLQRSVYTQFLVQATEDDPWGGQLEGSTVIEGNPGGKIYAGWSADPNSNAFNDFLEGYKPLEGRGLQEKIQGVINTLRVPQDDWLEYDPNDAKDYSPEQLRDFRWRNRFGVSAQSASNQQALAALPIMQQTPALLRNETATILKSLYDRWQANPGRNPNEGWLEFVDRNNYFGMIQEPTEKQQSGGIGIGAYD